MHRDILALVAPGQVGDGRVGRGLGRNRRLSGLDARDDVGGLLPGVVDGEVGVAMGPEADALRAAEGSRLDDEDLLARGVDSNPGAWKVAIPEDGVLAVDRETVHGALGEGAVLAFGHGSAIIRGGFCAAIFRELARKRRGSMVTATVDVGCDGLIAGLAMRRAV